MAQGVGSPTMVPGGKTAAPAGNDASVGTVSRLLPRANLLDSRSTPTEWKIERLFDQIALDETHRRQARRFENGVDSMTCTCLLYTSPSPRDRTRSRMPSSA